MKKPLVAFVLSLLLPGAGLAYAGKWSWGAINLAIVLLIGMIAALILSYATFMEYINIIAIACAVGSAGFARSVTEQLKGRRGVAGRE